MNVIELDIRYISHHNWLLRLRRLRGEFFVLIFFVLLLALEVLVARLEPGERLLRGGHGGRAGGGRRFLSYLLLTLFIFRLRWFLKSFRFSFRLLKGKLSQNIATRKKPAIKGMC